MKRLKRIFFIFTLLLLIVQNTNAMHDEEEKNNTPAQKINLQKEERNQEIAKTLLSHIPTAIKEEEQKEISLSLCHISPDNEERKDLFIAPLLSTSSLSLISPGIYESDDIELILSYPLKHFGNQDFVIFDVDQVLLAALAPYHFAHYKNNTPLHQKLISQDESVMNKFSLYMFVAHPWRIMDERTPSLIESLQSQRINCIANTALQPTINPHLNVDLPSLRVQTLREFNIDFSVTFPELTSWSFDTLEAEHIVKEVPLFKEGVIFSSEISKPITTLELFKKFAIKPRKVAFIDDNLENSREMYKVLNSQGIECFSFFYSKNKTTTLQRSYFPDDIFNEELQKIEVFLEKLLAGENVDAFFTKIKKDNENALKV